VCRTVTDFSRISGTSWKRHPRGAIYFSETRENHNGPFEAREEGGEGEREREKTAKFSAAKNCCTDWSGVMMDQPVLLPPLFGTFSAHWPPSGVATRPGGNAS